MIALFSMSQLLVRNLDRMTVQRLKKLAGEHGVSTEEQHRRILNAALSPTSGSEGVAAGSAFKQHLLDLGSIAEGIDFERPRRRSTHRIVEI
jgi:plasmid stability protein